MVFFHETRSHFVTRYIVEHIFSEYTRDRHVSLIKKIPFFIEGNKDNLNIFEVKESIFNGGEVTNMGRGTIDTCTQ